MAKQKNSSESSVTEAKRNTMGTIASLQTLLERYPVLVTVDPKTGSTSFSFMFNLLKILGVTDESLIEWLSKLLADKKDGSSGLLTAIEIAIKTIILTSLKEAYTCSVNPVLPDNIMHTPYDYDKASHFKAGSGIEVNINDIDSFGLLNNCPTDTYGSNFYFDTDKENGYTPLNVYSSTDFNAYLWYVINKGSFSGADDELRRKSVWDNRVYYRQMWEKEGCLIGDFENTSKGKFFEANCYESPTRMIKGIGPKQEYIICEFRESGTNSRKANNLIVYANSYRYYKTGILGKNKTIFEFNADYIAGLKLFDSKTVIAQIINSLLGLSASVGINMSIERQLIAEKIKAIVEKVIENEDEEVIDDCYYTFSNDEYNYLLEKALQKYNGVFPKNDINGGVSVVDSEAILSEISKIGKTGDLQTETTTIRNVLTSISSILTESNGGTEEPWAKCEFGMGLIEKFITETMVQIVMQVLSPKVMILYAINDKVMNPESPSLDGIISFFENFGNLIISMIKQIKNIILQELFDFLMGQIKPLITLFIQKLLLETISYYRLLITELIKNCTFTFNINNNDPLQIDDVNRADIIPVQEQPKNENSC